MGHKATAIGISSDQTTLYFSTNQKMIGIANLHSGQIHALLATENQLVQQICVSVSKGFDRVFFACGMQLQTCFNSETLVLSTPTLAPKISARHQSAVLKTICSTNHILSMSGDGHAVIWDPIDSFYTPVKEAQFDEDVISARLMPALECIILTIGSSAIIYSLKSNSEQIRVSHRLPLKDAILAMNRENETKSILYTWMSDGTISAWKLVGRNSLFFSYATDPLFTIHATLFPSHILSESGSELVVLNYNRVCHVDAITGLVIREYKTRNREALVDGCSCLNNGKPGILYATKTTLFLDDLCISYSGSLGDSLRIEKCKSSGDLVGYSGVEWSDVGMESMSDKVHFTGVVVVIQINGVKRRVCSLRHEDARILQWGFMFDSRLVCTIASDKMVRVWDIEAMQDGKAGKLICTYPMQSKATAMDVSDTEHKVMIGDESGGVIMLKIEGLKH